MLNSFFYILHNSLDNQGSKIYIQNIKLYSKYFYENRNKEIRCPAIIRSQQ